MENNYTVYMHIFPNNKKYIGITCQRTSRRWRDNGSGYSKKTQELVYNAIKRYGWKNVKHVIMFENLDEKTAKEKEIELIKQYDTYNRKFGYNRTEGGDINPMLGKHHTKRSLKMISEHSKGKNNPAAREVYQYDLQGNFIKRYDTVKEAAKETGINFVGISKCRSGSRLSAGGYIWKYKLENNVSRQTHYYKKPILQFDLEGHLIKEWESATAASKILQCHRKSIVNACLGKAKISHGYIWKYKKELLG